jgi:hypothetical protein
MKIGDDYEIVHDETAPKERRIVKKGQSETAQTQVTGLGGEKIDVRTIADISIHDMSDDDIRSLIERHTGTRPHHRTGRAKLIAEWEAAWPKYRAAMEGKAHGF